MEVENYSNLFANIFIWFSRTRFRTHHNNWLGNASKEEHFKRTKQVFKRRLPTHEVFPPSQHDWFAYLKGQFDKSCKRCWIEEIDMFKVRKSEPLYCDLIFNKTAVRANYWGGGLWILNQ